MSEAFNFVICQIYPQPKFCNKGFKFAEQRATRAGNYSLGCYKNITYCIQLYQTYNQYANYFFSELILPKSQYADLSLVLLWNSPSTEHARLDFNALHTTSTEISACTQTHTQRDACNMLQSPLAGFQMPNVCLIDRETNALTHA